MFLYQDTLVVNVSSSKSSPLTGTSIKKVQFSTSHAARKTVPISVAQVANNKHAKVQKNVCTGNCSIHCRDTLITLNENVNPSTCSVFLVLIISYVAVDVDLLAQYAAKLEKLKGKSSFLCTFFDMNLLNPTAENDALCKAAPAQPNSEPAILQPQKGVAGRGFNLCKAMRLEDNKALYCTFHVSSFLYSFIFIQPFIALHPKPGT